jgi:hypothetical protein
MAGYGLVQKFEAQTASGASTSSYIDTGGRPFSKMALRYVTMSTGALVTVYGCDTSDGTYLPVAVAEPGTAAAGYNNITVATSVSGGWGVFDAPPHRYLQFITSAVVSGGVSFTVIANG